MTVGNHHQGKFEGADLKYRNSLFKTLAPKYSYNASLIRNLSNFIFIGIFNYTNSRVLISNMAIVFQNSSPKTPKSGIIGPKFNVIYFCIKLYDKKNLIISNMTIVFSNYSKKILKYEIFFESSKVFSF